MRPRYKPTAEELRWLDGGWAPGNQECWHRASGDVRCTICGKKYYDHPQVEAPHEFLNRVCNGDFVKL